MRRAGWQGVLRALAALTVLCGCRTAPRPAPVEATGRADAGVVKTATTEGAAPQDGSVIADIGGTQVLALSAPGFAQLPRDQRLLAYWVSRAAAAGEATAIDQGYRHNLRVVRILRGILSRPAVVPAQLLQRIRTFARVVWLNGGLHDEQTGRKQTPPFTLADLRTAALAAQAAGADLGLGPLSLEYALRALEGPLFDPRVDAARTVHGKDLTASAVNLYDAVTTRDLRGLHEKYALNSRLARDDTFIVEQVIRLPAAAAALEQALPHAAPPQRDVLEPLAAFFRSGEPEPFRAAQATWIDALGPVDFFAGFFDRSSDPRGRKATFGGFVGLADAERTPLLQALAQAAPQLAEKLPPAGQPRGPSSRPPAVEALLLVSAAGSMRPLRSFALTLPLDGGEAKSALFAAAGDAVARLRTDAALRTLADPEVAPRLAPCLPSLRLTYLALRELVGRLPADAAQLEGGADALEEAHADLAAHFLSTDPLLVQLGFLTASCQSLWPQFAAAQWLAAAADLPQGERIEDDRQRALQLQIWWFTGKGALVERHVGGRRHLAVPDAARFHAAASGLLAVLQEIAALGDGARLADLLERHASRVDTQWRDEVLDHLRAAGIPRRIAVIPPRLDGTFTDGRLTDATASPVADLDAEIVRDWQGL